MPSPTLPAYFQHLKGSAQLETLNGTGSEEGTKVPEVIESSSREPISSGFRTVLKSNVEATSVADNMDQMEVLTPLPDETPSPIINQNSETNADQDNSIIAAAAAPAEIQSAAEQPARLAYVQVLSSPSQICSALLFFKLHREHGDEHIEHLILYPSKWEEDISTESFTTALALMHLIKDEYKIQPRPLKIGDSSEERIIERELIAHLATEEWDYDRMLYLRSPGLALNIGALDTALQGSKTQASLSRSWAPANPDSSAAPSILLLSGHGLYTPRGSNRGLTAEALSSHANHHENEMDVEAAAQTAAYVHFREGELRHRRTERGWYGGVFERYERGRAEICKGISFDEEKGE